jgi:hypothetical protein
LNVVDAAHGARTGAPYVVRGQDGNHSLETSGNFGRNGKDAPIGDIRPQESRDKIACLEAVRSVAPAPDYETAVLDTPKTPTDRSFTRLIIHL